MHAGEKTWHGGVTSTLERQATTINQQETAQKEGAQANERRHLAELRRNGAGQGVAVEQPARDQHVSASTETGKQRAESIVPGNTKGEAQWAQL